MVPAYFDQVLLLHRKLIAFGEKTETFTRKSAYVWAWTLYRRCSQDDYRIYRWIAAIPLLGNALMQPSPLDCRWAGGCFIILRACLMGDATISHCSSSWCGSLLCTGHQFLYWRYCVFLALLASRPYHYIRNSSSSERHCNWDYLFFFLALGVILIGSLKSSRPFPSL